MVNAMNLLSWASGRLFKVLAFLFILSILILTARKLSRFSQTVKPLKIISAKRSTFTQTYTLKGASSDVLLKLSKKFKHVSKPSVITNSRPTKTLRKVPVVKNKRPIPCYNVHAFYYPWYGNPEFEKKYLHWNHRYLPHWNPEIAKMYLSGVHKPPDDISSDFYPELGPYSSRDPKVIQSHMAQLSFAGVGAIFVSYYPPGSADDNGEDWANIFPMLLDGAEKYKIKVGFHIEPYKSRNENTVREDFENIINTYSSHSAFYTHTHQGKTLPLIYIYDSYHTKPEAWAQILKPGPTSIRGTQYDAFVIGLCVNEQDSLELSYGGFDGYYTYFAANGFTFGSTRENWKHLNSFAKDKNMMFIPSVGPGYIDTKIRPWNKENTRKRANGKYYSESWGSALKLNTELISITSFNEWHEGTQIEKAIPHKFGHYEYENYLPHNSDYYLVMTKYFIKTYKVCI